MDIDVIYNEDCLEVLKRIEDNSIDAIITDPPYNLGFMGKRWDKTGIAAQIDLWQECLRVIKPGGNLLSFGGTRTYHRMVCAIEDAGFEIRDCIMWVYGSGFPKSLDISKAIDKQAGAIREIISPKKNISHIDRGDSNIENQIYKHKDSIFTKAEKSSMITTPSTSEAKLWEGYGTGLKPAVEPIVLARKPISEKTIAENCLKWGVGGLNIDGCRIEIDRNDKFGGGGMATGGYGAFKDNYKHDGFKVSTQGRFPANFIHDGSQEVMELFPETSKAGNIRPSDMTKGTSVFGIGQRVANPKILNDNGGSAARFFYCAKASKKERNMGCEDLENQKYVAGNYSQSPVCKTCNKTLNGSNDHSNCSGEVYYKEMPSRNTGNNHPTVKPLALMEYLIKLVTRPGHIVLDPFIGSGTTAIAAINTNRHYLGCELDKGYYDIAIKRIEEAKQRDRSNGH